MPPGCGDLVRGKARGGELTSTTPVRNRTIYPAAKDDAKAARLGLWFDTQPMPHRNGDTFGALLSLALIRTDAFVPIRRGVALSLIKRHAQAIEGKPRAIRLAS